MTRTIFFDLDGTLTDSKAGIFNGLDYAFQKMGLPILPVKTKLLFIGPALKDTLPKYTGIRDADNIKEFIQYFHDYYATKGWRENKPFPGITDMLAKLQKAGFDLALATAKPETSARRISDLFHFTQYLKDIFAATDDEVTRVRKVEIVHYGLTQLKIDDPSQCVMVGDRADDIKAGQANHLKTVGVLYGFGSTKELSTAAPTLLVPSVKALSRSLLANAF